MKYLALCREGSEIVAAKDVIGAIQPIVHCCGDSNILEVNIPKLFLFTKSMSVSCSTWVTSSREVH